MIAHRPDDQPGLTACVVPNCGNPVCNSSAEEYCAVHHMLVWNYTNWLHGWAREFFDGDRLALDQGRRRV